MLRRKALQNKKESCKWCGGRNHLSLTCYRRPKHPLLKESKTARSKRQSMASIWFRQNPPDENGNWYCYLQITKRCPKVLTRETITLEHVYPRARYPELKYRVENIKPSCAFCNKEKGKNTLAQIALLYPHIASMITSAAWEQWDSDLQRFVKQELH